MKREPVRRRRRRAYEPERGARLARCGRMITGSQVLVFGRPPDAEDGSPDRVLAHAACNVAAEAPSLACRIEPRAIETEAGTIETSRLVIVGDCDTHADDLLSTRSEDERSDRDIAAEWLTDELADGDWHRASEIKAQAKAAGVSEKTLRRARERLGVEDRREGFPAVSEWRLPVVPNPTGHDCDSSSGHDYENRAVEPNLNGNGPSGAQDKRVGTTERNGHERLPVELDLTPRSRPLTAQRCECDRPLLDDERMCSKCGRIRPANALTADCEVSA
jgi:hypothetical protein